jgi:hypothetical protein
VASDKTKLTPRFLVEYLSSLRNDRPARPSGSRPPPFKTSTYPSPAKDNLSPRSSATFPAKSFKSEVDSYPTVNASGHSSGDHALHRGVNSPALSTSSARSRVGLGRPLVPAPANDKAYSIRGRKVSPTAVIQAPLHDETVPYRESGARWMERQEAISLRDALQVMDQQEEENRVHKAAQDEAADLVWKHQNPLAAETEKGRPFRNPDVYPNNRFRTHLQKGAHARSQSVAAAELARDIPRSDSFGSISGSSPRSGSGNNHGHPAVPKRFSMLETGTVPPSANYAPNSTQKNPAVASAPSNLPADRRRSSGPRHVSSGSSKGVFRNPKDQIYEEPAEPLATNGSTEAQPGQEPMPLKNRHRNSLAHGSRPLPDRSSTTPESMKTDRFEIHKNPPSQSRNAAYTENPAGPSPAIEVIREVDTPTSKDGMEIRGGDIRAATTMRRKDRSPKLPTPTAVSDVPGRPIVSFDKTWQPAEETIYSENPTERESSRASPIVPVVMLSAPAVPTINLPDDDEAVTPVANKAGAPIPSISFPDNSTTPTISVSSPSEHRSIEVSTPSNEQQPRPLPRPGNSSPANLLPTTSASRLPWLNPATRAGVPTATCTACSLPISGRIVTASGSNSDHCAHLKAMFHPECFTCHHCSTALECVAFYPEPTNKRHERLEAEGMPADSDADIRFFCHLDFHEFFSPRCKSCKTPIEGEVIVAVGAEWHVGHFFCGECGDPFDSNTPFVERDGHAYCVRCHTRRTSARCRACKKQILDEMAVEALGGRWHETCFVCFECTGGFGDEGRFFVRDVEVECTEKEKRRGTKAKMEERAVCQGCEEKRLKA